MTSVLVVDDMSVFREPIAAALRSRGFETSEAGEGREAIRLALQERPDIVLLDLAMPQVDGLTVLRALRTDERCAQTPVIVLTAVAERRLVMESGRLGVSAYMLKSRFSLDELVERIGQAIGKTGTAPASGRGAPAKAVQASDAAPASSQGAGEAGSRPAHEAASGAGSPACKDADKETAPRDASAAKVVSAGSEDDLKALKPLLSRSEMQEHLDACGGLKAMSPTVAQVLELSRNPRVSIDQLTRAIKQDHAISLKVLRLANSAVYTRGEPVDSVQKAIMRIGMQQISQAVMNIAVVESFGESVDPRLNAPQFWEHSIATGLIAAEIARSLGEKDDAVDAAFTMGLLHDVGRVVYADTLGEQYIRVMDEADRLSLPLELVESRLLLINHADAMDRVLHAWRFPKELINPIALHHLSVGNIRRMAARSVAEVATLALANRLAHALMLGSSGNRMVYPTEEFAEALRVPKDLLSRIEHEIPGEAADMKFTLLSRSSSGGEEWPQMIDQAQGALPGPVKAIHASGSPDFDAYRLLFSRLGKDAGDIEPNLGVMRLRDARERSRVTQAYMQAEAEAGTGRLPLLVVSPKGGLKPDPEAMKDRRVVQLPAVIRLDALLASVSDLLAAEAPAAKAA